MIEQPSSCPFCKSIVMIDIKWAIQNGRVFCGGCCKSFEVHIGEEEPDLPVNKDAQIETALEELEKEMDKAVDDWSWF